jgi:type IV secretory pathway VirD2 relaxase
MQRVTVKARVVRSAPSGGSSLHLKYLERDGAGAEGDRGKVFSKSGFLPEEEKAQWLR